MFSPSHLLPRLEQAPLEVSRHGLSRHFLERAFLLSQPARHLSPGRVVCRLWRLELAPQNDPFTFPGPQHREVASLTPHDPLRQDSVRQTQAGIAARLDPIFHRDMSLNLSSVQTQIHAPDRQRQPASGLPHPVPRPTSHGAHKQKTRSPIPGPGRSFRAGFEMNCGSGW